MSYGRAVLIYNPAAGRRRAQREREVTRAAQMLRNRVESVETVPTGERLRAVELAREARRNGAGLVIACGGDGTINEVVNGLAHSSVPLAVLPAGTANVLAMEVGLPLDVCRTAAMLEELVPRRIALGRVQCCGPQLQPRYFLLMAGAGMDARIVYTLSARLKTRLGLLAYWVTSFGQLGRRLDPFQVAIDGRQYECTFALASKSRAYGGRLWIARRAHLLSNELEAVLFHSRSSFRYLRYLAGVARGNLERLPDVTFLNTRRVELMLPEGESGRVHVQVDGEYAGRLPATIDIVQDALTLLMPPAYVQTHG